MRIRIEVYYSPLHPLASKYIDTQRYSPIAKKREE